MERRRTLRRCRWGPLATVFAAAVLAVTACGTPTQSIATHGATDAEGARFALGGRILDTSSGRSSNIAHDVAAPMGGAAAIPSPDGTRLLYSTWESLTSEDPWADPVAVGTAVGRPSLHVADQDGAHDTVLDQGAFAPAWSATGRIAYVKATDPDVRQGQPYVGQVVVRSSTTGSPVAWTRASRRYQVLGWAGETLLWGTTSADGLSSEIYAARGPGEATLVASGEGVLAIAPSGDAVLLASNEIGDTRLRVLSLGDGTTKAIDLRAIGEPLVGTEGASWVGSRAIISAVVSTGPAFVVIDMDRLVADEPIPVDGAAHPSLHDPYFAPGGRVGGWSTDGPVRIEKGQQPPDRPYVLVSCGIANRRCTSQTLPEGRTIARVRTASRSAGRSVSEVEG